MTDDSRLTFLSKPWWPRAQSLAEGASFSPRPNITVMRKDGHIDPGLFDLFLTSGVYRAYAERFLRPAQIDDVDISRYRSTVGAA